MCERLGSILPKLGLGIVYFYVVLTEALFKAFLNSAKLAEADHALAILVPKLVEHHPNTISKSEDSGVLLKSRVFPIATLQVIVGD